MADDVTLLVVEPVTSGTNVVTHDFLEKEGADGAAVTQIDYSFNYQGMDYTGSYQLDGSEDDQSFNVVANGENLGQVVINADGSVSFAPSRDLDNSPDTEDVAAEGDQPAIIDPIIGTLTATVVDNDGDTKTSVATIQIGDGQTPVIDVEDSDLTGAEVFESAYRRL
ncbi:hypothetical protein JCM19233_2470 [Vibrio astriarenae]|nr:hypothetical protein JCM19233_2470 [Vibrio sp. C7]